MKKLIYALLLTFFVTSPVFATIKSIGTTTVVDTKNKVVYIMTAKTTTGTGEAYTVYPGSRSLHATVTGTGAVTATIRIQVCNHGCDTEANWINSTTTPHIALSGTTTAADGFIMNAKWAYVKAYIDAISGTGAAVTVTMGV